MTKRAVGRLVAVLVVLTVVSSSAPLAAASHRALYDDFVGQNVFGGAGNSPDGTPNVRDEGLRVTYEPDYESTDYWTPGSSIDNCIVDLEEVWDGSLPAAVDLDPSHPYAGHCDSGALASDLGDSQLFLDASVVTQEGAPAANEFIAASHYWRTITGDSRNIILPGKNSISAWFGHWNDVNGDGRIDDVCSWDTRPERQAADEFEWRGQASAENGGAWDIPTPPYKFAIYAWMDPGFYGPNDPPLENVPTIPPAGPKASETYDQRLDDRTGEDSKPLGCPSNTGWIAERGFNFYNYQTSLVWTLRMATVVNPGGSSSGNPSASGIAGSPFIDVDVYSSLSPEVEDLTYDSIGLPGFILNETFNLVDDVLDVLDASCAAVKNASGDDYCDDAVTPVCDDVAGASGIDACAADPVGDVCTLALNATGGYDFCDDVIGESCRLVGDNAGTDPCLVDVFTPACELGSEVAGYAVCEEPERPAQDIANEHDAEQSRVSRAMNALHPHEPNTPFDEYPGAAYGGTSFAAGGSDGFPACTTDSPSSPVGSCNDYVLLVDTDNDANTTDEATGYAGGWHAWTDSVPVQHIPAFMRPYATPPAVGLLVGGGFSTGQHPSVYASDGSHGKYSDINYIAGTEYQWAAPVGQWLDGNEDTWIGNVANDASPYGNASIIDPGASADFYRPDPNTYPSPSAGEWRSLCGLTGRVLDVDVKLVPLSGSWGDGVIVRWEYLEPGKPTTGDNPGRTYVDVILAGEIVLNNGCPFLGDERAVTSDKVVFLGGNVAIDFAVVTTVTVVVDTTPSSTADNPDTLVTEIVTDVDVYSVPS